MHTDYTAQTQALTTEQLKTILSEYRTYEPQLVLAAMAELQQRGIVIPNPAQLHQELLQVIEEMEQPKKKTPAQKAKNFLMVFVPQPQYQVTPVILNINLLVFIVGTILGLDIMNPDAGRLIEMGANFGPYTLSEEWWRLLTSMFLHGGLLHLLFNMMALVNIGAQLEAMVGRTQFLLAYILCGLAGSVTSLWWTSPEISVSVGASGAIFGLFGMMLILFVLERQLDWKSKRAILSNMAVVIGINLAFGMRANIDNAAHIGGLVAGILYGAVLLLRSGRYITHRYNTTGTAVTAAVGVALIVGFFSFIPFQGKVRWAYVLEQVGKKEMVAMQAVVALDKAGDEYDAKELLPLVKEGMQLWEESEVLLESMEDVPEEEQGKLSALLDYVRLRKLSYQMLHDDLEAGQPLMHQKQQQMLSAIGSYASMLQENDFSSLTSQKMTPEEEEHAANLLTNSEGKALDSADFSAIKEPLYVLDGKELGTAPVAEALPEVRALLPSDIEHVTLLKGPEAVKIYGDKAAGGAVIINTKK